ncbi:hypothetical protein Mjas_03945 [Methanothermococcus sp. Ax23]|uniref:hypothetical protein n=1 Tax=Methanothermococcus sp. Ax23 TaxID=3156486 RepID=UPI003B9FAA24
MNKLDYALDKLKGVKGYDGVLEEIKKGKSGTPYEAIVVAEKCNVDEIVELSKDGIKTSRGPTEADIITMDKVIECKGGDVLKDWNRFTRQLSKLSEYAKNNNKKLVYYFRLKPDDKVIKKLNKAKSKYGVDIEYHVYNP